MTKRIGAWMIFLGCLLALSFSATPYSEPRIKCWRAHANASGAQTRTQILTFLARTQMLTFLAKPKRVTLEAS